MTKTSFQELELLEPLLRAVHEQGYDTPTPIQSQSIPHLIDGRDLLGIAQTGTGKTAAFALPILDFLAGDPKKPVPRRPSALILTPTRELASQIGDSFAVYGKHTAVKHTVIFGGVPQGAQVRILKQGVDVLVATPGRLIDLISQKQVDLRDVEVFVLDEADRMLDMGFIHDVRRIITQLPKDRQSLLFSATMPPDIVDISRSILKDPVRVEVTPPATTVERIDQSLMYVEKADKRKLLLEVLRDTSIDRVLVFTRTKHGADRVVKFLRRGEMKADSIHGNKSQGQRERALEGFRTGRRAGHHPRGQLRPAEHPRQLRASHRSHGARRPRRQGDLVLRRRRAGVPAGHREADPLQPDRRQGTPLPVEDAARRHPARAQEEGRDREEDRWSASFTWRSALPSQPRPSLRRRWWWWWRRRRWRQEARRQRRPALRLIDRAQGSSAALSRSSPPKATRRRRSASTGPSSLVLPPGHRISIRSTRAASPSPITSAESEWLS